MPVPITTKFSELGRTGLIQHSGYVQEEFLRELTGIRWRRAVREMLWNDPVISSMFFAIEMLIRQVKWDVVSPTKDNEDTQRAEFVKGALFDDMSQPWKETLAEILSYLPWGWSWHEVVYKRRNGESGDPSKSSKFSDGRIGWRKWPIRAQESLMRWDFDDGGGIQAMIQRAAPTYETVTIPIEKSLLFRTSIHKNNPEGKSLLRGVYRPWYFKQRIENIEGIGVERDLAGLPHMQIPAEYLDPNASTEKKAIADYCKELVTNVRQDELAGIVTPSDLWPDTDKPMFSFELVSTGGTRQFDTNKIIQRYDQRILMTLMADFLLLGHEKVGSFALASSKTDMFATALGAFLDSIQDVVNRHAIPKLLKLNGLPTQNSPQLQHGDIESIDLAEVADFMSKVSGLNPKIIAYLFEQAGIPIPEDVATIISQQTTANNDKPNPTEKPGTATGDPTDPENDGEDEAQP